MQDSDVSAITDASGVISTMVVAFSADPFVRWMLPEPSAYLQHFAELARLHGARTAPNGGAFAGAGGRSAALWYPPGIHPDGDALGALFVAARIADRVAGVWQALAPYEPEAPHWYLRQIGVDPALQGTGSGSALLAAALREIDARGDVAYLEATTRRGAALYERHGFEVLGEVQIDDAPPLWPMRRDAR